MRRTGKMQITSESGMEKDATVKKLWPKQNKIRNYGHFLCILGPKMTTLEEALPMGPQSWSLCFWNQWNMGNGKTHRANLESNFSFFCPPLVPILGRQNRGDPDYSSISAMDVHGEGWKIYSGICRRVSDSRPWKYSGGSSDTVPVFLRNNWTYGPRLRDISLIDTQNPSAGKSFCFLILSSIQRFLQKFWRLESQVGKLFCGFYCFPPYKKSFFS